MIQRLTAFRDEARALADAPSVASEQVEDWRKRTEAALNEIFGPDADAVRAFGRIKFDDSKIVGAAERVLREAAEHQGTDISGVRIRLPSPEAALRRGLYEAADLLSSLIIG